VREVYAYLISVGIISASVLYFSINFLFVLSEIKVHFVYLLLSLLNINVVVQGVQLKSGPLTKP